MIKKIKFILPALIFLVFSLSLISASNSSNPSINLDVDDIKEGEEAELEITINTDGLTTKKILTKWGDGEKDSQEIPFSGRGVPLDYSHEYEKAGEYEIEVEVEFENHSSEKETIDIEVEEKVEEDKKPTIIITYPKNNPLIKTDTVTFKFTPNDDKNLSICDFKVYKKHNNQNILEYNDSVQNPELNKEYSLTLKEFEDANYSYQITCKDNKSQSITASEKFTIKTQKHKREKEINSKIELIESFLNKEFTPEQEETLTELEILKDLRFYKKRLAQINLDLGSDFVSITDETKKQQRKQELVEEYEEIKDKIPLDVKTIDNSEYIKNSKINSLYNITKQYVNLNKMDLSERRIKILSKKNEEIQNKISTKAKINQIEIEYNDSTEKITLIKKEIKISDQSLSNILETIPQELGEVTLITPLTKITKGLYEADLDKLNSNQIKYYIKEQVNPELIKKSQTLLFKRFSTDGLTLVGLSILGVEVDENIHWFGTGIFMILLGAGLIVYKTKFTKSGEIKKLCNVQKQGLDAIKKQELEQAKEKYHQAKEIYNTLNKEQKHKIYPKLKELRDQINKKEMLELIKEYKKQKISNPENAENLFKKIKQKYKHLPEKYQKKIHEKIIMLE